MVAEPGVRLAREGYAAVDEPVDRTLAVFDDQSCGARIAQLGAGDEGVAHMRFDAVCSIEYGGNAALRPVARAVRKLALGHEGDAHAVGEAQCHRLPGGAAAKDEYVVLFQQDVALARGKGRNIACRGAVPRGQARWSVRAGGR